MVKGYLIVIVNKYSNYQVLVAANDEDEAIKISGYDRSKVTHVFQWDGRWTFYWEGVLMNIKYYLDNHVEDDQAHIITDDINRSLNDLLKKKVQKKEKKEDYIKEALSTANKLDLPKIESRSEMIEDAKRMMTEAYDETDRGGFNEWDQTFVELLKNKLLNHLDTEGLNILMDTIEVNSDTVKRA
ncbi:hypothetical protein M5X17_31040 [Paenibacillus alvei]|uniref:hypothetical protein n=1 Tax=Paenibacillus alvei TaxID=44250 RepID=UPI00228190C3|nr:hypothetical protein [Paenibacillus alvei]MCY9738129.1 hypothetical protein [Paenibacillus alvei]